MAPAIGGGSPVRRGTGQTEPALFCMALPPTLLVAAIGMVVGAAAGLATCVLLGLI